MTRPPGRRLHCAGDPDGHALSAKDADMCRCGAWVCTAHKVCVWCRADDVDRKRAEQERQVREGEV